MTKAKRLEVYNKHQGHCAYCGKAIQYTDMQVDHVQAKCNGGTDTIDNLMPSCRSCNHYKRSSGIETFRKMLKTLHERTQKIYINKVAEDYGVIKVEPWDGKFYFEKVRG